MRWKTVKLGDVAEAIRGVTFSSGQAESEPFDNSIACLTTSGVQQEVNWPSRRFIPLDCVKQEKQILKIGDILVSTANSKELVGKSSFVSGLPYSSTFGAFVTVVRPKGNVVPYYLAKWMKTAEFLNTCYVACSNTTNISNLRVSELMAFEMPLPPLEEQQRIAGILARADRLRQLRRYALQLSEGYLQSVFLQMFGDPVTRESWPLVKVESLAAKGKNTIRTGPFGSDLLHSEFNDDSNGVMVFGIDNAVQNRFDWGKSRYITQEKYAKLKRYTVYPDDVLITIMGTCGRCAVVPKNIPLAINTKHLCCITLEKTKCLPTFLHSSFLLDPTVLNQLGVSERGAIMAGLNSTIIKGLELRLPPLPLQQQYEEVVQKFERLQAQQREAARQADHLFATLLHRAFTPSP